MVKSYIGVCAHITAAASVEMTSMLQAKSLLQSMTTGSANQNLNILQMQAMRDNFKNMAEASDVDSEMQKLADFVKVNVTGVQKTMTTNRKDKLNEDLVAKLDSFTACSNAFAAAKDLDQNAFNGENGKVTESRDAHSTCRSELATLDSNKNKACGDLEAYIAAVPAPDSCVVPQRSGGKQYFEDLQAYVYNHQVTWQNMDELCTEYEDNTTAKLASCKSDQESFEEDFCEWRLQTYTTCNEQSTCYHEASGEFNQLVSSSQDEEVELKMEFSVASNIECLLDVMISGDTVEKRQSDATACVSTDVDTGMLTLAIPSVPANEVCDFSLVQHHPCGSGFVVDEYKGMKFVEECNACPALPQFTHAIEEIRSHYDHMLFQKVGCPIVGQGYHHVVAFDSEGRLQCEASDGGGDCNNDELKDLKVSDIKQMIVGGDATCVLLADSRTVNCYASDGNQARDRVFDKDVQSIHNLAHNWCARFADLTLDCQANGHDWNGQDYRGLIERAFSGKQWKKWIGGFYEACIINLEKKLECVGYNDGGGHQTTVNVPTGEVLDADCGIYCCAIMADDGRLQCWGGGNHHGSNDWPRDLRYPDGLALQYWNGMAIKDGVQYTWGYHDNGHGHDGHHVNQQIPAEVADNHDTLLFDGNTASHSTCGILPSEAGMQFLCWHSFGTGTHSASRSGARLTDNKFMVSFTHEQCKTTWHF